MDSAGTPSASAESFWLASFNDGSEERAASPSSSRPAICQRFWLRWTQLDQAEHAGREQRAKSASKPVRQSEPGLLVRQPSCDH